MGDSYSAAIRRNAPQNGADLLRARALNGKSINERLADWLKEYSQVQRHHAQELERFLTKHASDGEDFGTLTEPWQKVSFYIAEQQRLTSDLAKRVQVEAERPIREQAFGSRVERSLSEFKGESTVPEHTIDEIQRLDEQRLENIKNSLVRFLTVEVDRAQAQTSNGERAMQNWLVYEPKDDISSFVAQIVSGVAPTAPVGGAHGTHGSGTHGSSSHGHQSQSQQRNASTATGASSRQASQASQSTVRRRTSLLMLGGGGGHKNENTSKSPTSNLRSKVGSIFGRKKKSKEPVSPQRTPTGSIDRGSGNAAVTRPPDFGPRQHSHLSSASINSSPAASLRNQRIREAPNDELYSPASPSPRRSGVAATTNSSSGGPTSGGPPSAVAPSVSDGAHAPPTGPSAVPQFGLGHANGSGSMVAPLTPTKVQPRSRDNSVTGARTQSPLHDTSRSGADVGTGIVGGSALGTVGAGAASAASAGGASAGAKPNGFDQQLQSPLHDPNYGSAPAPPPTRSIHRENSLGRHPSNASVSRLQRSGSLNRSNSQREAREARVGSQVFATLPPTMDSGRNSVIYGQGPPGSIEQQQQQQLHGADKHTSLPSIPGTPHNAGISSPEQFWTPAARFPTQFSSFEQANTSLASIGSVRAPTLPPLPANEGLVAAAVEHIEAEYEGEELVRGKITGEAIAHVNGGPASTQESLVLGILLADPNSKLTPNPALRQTSSLSFDLPTALFAAPHELVHYTAESAVGRVPIKLTPVWRFDAKTVRLVLSFQLSDLYVGSDEVEVTDLVIAVSIRGQARAHSAQSKPVATFSREKQRVTWRFNQPQILRRGQPATKLLCQFVTDGAPSQPGTIELKARLPSVINSVLQLRTLSPQGEWIPVPTAVASDVQSHFSELTPPPANAKGSGAGAAIGATAGGSESGSPLGASPSGLPTSSVPAGAF